MDYSVEQAVEILSKTPAVLKAMLDGVGDDWSLEDYGEGTWSAFDIVGHLIFGERTDWIPRARIILGQGESRPFVPFDRLGQVKESKGKTLANLLTEFEQARAANIEALLAMRLTDGLLDRRGTHPEFGSVALRALLAAWVVHDLNHIAQTAKAMAFQYEEQVGPWKKYLSILRPPEPR